MKLTLSLWILLFFGCALGPDYERPAVEMPAQWKNADASLSEDLPPLDADWWKVFGDARLEELIQTALASNPTLQGAMERVEEARSEARAAVSDFFPRVDLNPSAQRARRTTSNFGGRGGAFTNNTFLLPLDMSYELDLWGELRRTYEARSRQFHASEAAAQTVRLTLAAEVAQNYFQLRQLDAEAQILGKTVQLRQDAFGLIQNRAQGGVVSDLDVARVKTELANAEADLADVRRRRAEIENALATLCGKPAPSFTMEAAPLDLPVPSIPPGLPSVLLQRRPDVQEAEHLLAAANAEIGLAKTALFPQFSLTGFAGFQSDELNMVADTKSRIWSALFDIAAPLFTAGKGTAKLKGTWARYRQALAEYRKRLLTAFEEVENALANLKMEAVRARAQDRALESSRRAAELSDLRYRQGLVNFLEVIDAERQRLQAERQSVQTLSRRLVSTVTLIKALGGAWEDVEPPAPVLATKSHPLDIPQPPPVFQGPAKSLEEVYARFRQIFST